MATSLEQKKKARAAFMKRLYEETDGHTRAMVSMWDLGEALELPREQTDAVTDYLEKEGLLSFEAMGGQIAITHDGVKEIEQALEAPDQPTLHFPPINIINVHHMENSQIMQASPNAVQSLEVVLDVTGVRELLEILQRVGDEIEKLPRDGAAEARSDIATIQAQAASPRPKTAIVLGALKSLKTIFEGATGGVIGTLALPKITALIQTLSQTIGP